MDISKYDFKYKGVMKDAMQSIPVGNGDLGANIWADKNKLSLLLSKTDAWSEVHRLLKTGLLSLTLSPNPFNRKTQWRLSYGDGVLYVTAKDAVMRIYADANAPVYRISFSSKTKRSVKLEVVNYRDEAVTLAPYDHSNYHMMSEVPEPKRSIFSLLKRKKKEAFTNPFDFDCAESADTVFSKTAHSVGQYHHNDTSCYDFTLSHQSLGAFPEKRDPLLFRTFGFLAHSEQLSFDGSALTGENVTDFDITIVSHTDVCENCGEWVEKAYTLLGGASEDFESHKKYWSDIWKKSYIEVTGGRDARLITEGYISQRYLTVCAGRGECPIKFNGSIFTNQPSPYADGKNYDFRRWGGPYWFQNTRLVYWGMLFNGDYEMMKPFFKMYIDALPLAKYRTKEYFGHEGAFYPETMTLFATYSNKDYGARREGLDKTFIPNPYIKYYFVGALELCMMMLRYVYHTDDREFLKNGLLPFAEEILKFYRYHFKEKKGKLYFYPSASLETWHDCADDTPTISGLYIVTKDLLKCGEASPELTALCSEIQELLPALPYSEKNGKKVVAPFTENMDEVRKNVENPELYTVFPFMQYGLGKYGLEIARNTYRERDIKESGGWQQHGIQAALLGLSDEAEKELLHNCRNKNPKCIFPAFWGPNYDWLPDQDNGANIIMTLTNMLVQSDEREIRLLPAWNAERDASFRLPVGENNFVELVFENGKIKSCEFANVPKRSVTKKYR